MPSPPSPPVAPPAPSADPLAGNWLPDFLLKESRLYPL